MPEAGARTAGLESGDVHLVETVEGATAERLRGNEAYQVHNVLPFAFQVIKFNHAAAPTDDVNFRKAVAAALDMEEIMAIAYAGIHELDGGWLFPNSDYYTEAGLDAYKQADLERSEEQTSELQSLMRNPYAVFCLKKHKDI